MASMEGCNIEDGQVSFDSVRFELKRLLCEENPRAGDASLGRDEWTIRCLERFQKYVLDRARHCARRVFPHSPIVAGVGGGLSVCVGMVQEVEPSVAYFDVGAYFGLSVEDSEEATADGADRWLVGAQALYLVPVPGCPHLYPPSAQQAVNAPSPAAFDESTRPKRPLVDESNAAEVGASSGAAEKRRRVDALPPKTDGSGAPREERALWQQLSLPHRPLRDDLLVACSVIVMEPHTIRAGDVVVVAGFTDDTWSVGAADDDGFENFSVTNAEKFPPGLVRRLVCLGHAAYRPPVALDLAAMSDRRLIEELRGQTLELLCNNVLGSSVSAAATAGELLLLHLCSRVQFRSNQVPIGDVPLFLHSPGWTQHSALHASQQLQHMLPLGDVFVDLRSISGPLHPRKDYDRNVLECGPLQVGNGSHVTLWVAAGAREPLAPGHDDTLLAVLHKQVLPVEYPYSDPVELPMDVGYLVLSNGPPGAMPSPSLRLATSAAVPSPTHISHCSTPGSHEAARRYFEFVRHHGPAVAPVAEELGLAIQQDIVETKHRRPQHFNSDALLHNNSINCIVALTKLVATSLGRADVVAGDYEFVKGLVCPSP